MAVQLGMFFARALGRSFVALTAGGLTVGGLTMGCDGITQSDGVCSTDEGTIEWRASIVSGDPEDYSEGDVEVTEGLVRLIVGSHAFEFPDVVEHLDSVEKSGAFPPRADGAGGAQGNEIAGSYLGAAECALSSGEAGTTEVMVIADSGEVIPGAIFEGEQEGGVRRGFASDDFERVLEVTFFVGAPEEEDEFTPSACSEAIPTGTITVRFEAEPEDVVFEDDASDPDC